MPPPKEDKGKSEADYGPDVPPGSPVSTAPSDDLAERAEALRRQINEKKMTEVNEVITNIRANAANRSYGVFLSKLPSLLPAGAELQSLEIDEKQGVIMSGLALENAAINDLKRNLRSAKILRRDPQIETEKEGDYWRFSMTLALSRMQ